MTKKSLSYRVQTHKSERSALLTVPAKILKPVFPKRTSLEAKAMQEMS
jgi:hypothetical protein